MAATDASSIKILIRIIVTLNSGISGRDMNDFMTKQEFRKSIKEFARRELISKIIIEDKLVGKKIIFTMNGIKEAINQPHKLYNEKNNAIFNIVELIKNSKYIKSTNEQKENPMIKQYHYFEIKIKNECSFIVIRERKDGVCSFYSIVEKCK